MNIMTDRTQLSQQSRSDDSRKVWPYAESIPGDHSIEFPGALYAPAIVLFSEGT